MPRVIHFEIPADQPQRAADFYAAVFGWTVQKWEGPMEYWMVTTGPDGTPGINGGLAKRVAGFATVVNTIDVPSVDEATAKAQSHGGKVVQPKHAIPGVGWLAYCVDPEGNAFGVMQSDPAAS